MGACVTATFVLMLFPDGRLLSPAWRPLPWLAGIGIVLTASAFALRPGRLLLSVYVDNPLAIAAMSDAILSVGLLGLGLVLGAVVMSVASLAVRYRRAHVLERQQIKWIAYVAGIHAVLAFAIFTLIRDLNPAFVALAASAIPIAIGIAILRHRLYDIDPLIKRTMAYGATSAALALVFFASILALQAYYARSQPVGARHRSLDARQPRPVPADPTPVQDAVNHRFDRSRYNASFTFDAFADRLRDEVDLDEVRADLLGAVRQTMAPAHASLWLREIRRG